jgi:YD repeat-containing protein
MPFWGHGAVRRWCFGELSRGVANGFWFPVKLVSLVALASAPLASEALTVNRINGSASVIYVDFSIPGKVIPLELVRTYNSITALSESTGWSGAFGWGWTSPFETTLTVTPERQVMLRDGQTGNTINFKPQKEDPKVRAQFFESVRAAYFERKLGRKPTKEEYARLQLPENVAARLKSEPAFRAEMADKLGIQLPIPQGELLVSNEYGYQTLQFKANQWTRQKDGITQQFDKDGRLVRQTDRNGVSLLYRYAAGGKGELAEIADTESFMSLKLTWRQGRVVEVVDNKGRRARYSYDGSGNLTQVIDSNGQTYGYRYENRKFPHALTHIDYLSEASTSGTPTRLISYDEAGLVVLHRDKDGTETNYIYGRSTSDPQNQFTTKMIRKSRTGVEEQFDEYQLKDRGDGSKYLYRQLSRQGNETTITIFSACCAKPLQSTKNGQTTKFAYYEDGLLKEKVGPSERVSLEYDPRWKKVTKVNQNGFTSRYEYDAQGNLVRASNSRSDRVALKYDKFGRILEMSDSEGRKLVFRYGESGRPVVIEEPGIGKIQLEYDPGGRIKKATTLAANEGQGRRPSEAKSQEVVKRVLRGFQLLMDVLRPAGVSVLGS